jgi:iron complex outermembrane receptor protein
MQHLRFHAPRLGLLLAAATLAANAAPVTTNAPIVVTASRVNQTAEEMPASVTVIDANAIRQSGAQNVVTALETLGGVYFRRSSDNPGQADISMRGFSQNSHGRVLVLVDGQRLNTADMASLDWLRIPVSSVERIEVLRGGQTALYGDYAVAGVINIITHQPADHPVTTLSVSGGSDRSVAVHAGHAGSVGDTRYTVDADWRRSDGWRDNSDYQNTDVRAALTHDWTPAFASDLSVFYTDNTYGMPGWLTGGDMASDPRQTYTPRDNAATRTWGGTLGARGQPDADSRITGAFAASRRTIASDTFSAPPFFSPSFFSDTTLDSFAFTPAYTLDTDVAGHRDRLLLGVDLGLEQYDLQGYTDHARTARVQDGAIDRSHAAAYGQNEFWLTPELSLLLGARGELCQYDSRVATGLPGPGSSRAERLCRESAFDAALVYRPTDTLKLFARAGTLYRNPFVDEMVTINQSYATTNPAHISDLKPETGRQFEVGATATLAREWTLDVSAYRLDMRGEIAWQPDDPADWSVISGYNANLDETRRYGADAALTWTRSGVGLFSATYNYVDARFASGPAEDKRVPLVPPHVLTLRGELELPFDLTALAAFHAVSHQFSGGDNQNLYARLPSYATLDLGLRYHPHTVEGLDLFVGVDNVCDHIYASTGYYGYSFYPAPGRTWKAGASYQF